MMDTTTLIPCFDTILSMYDGLESLFRYKLIIKWFTVSTKDFSRPKTLSRTGGVLLVKKGEKSS